MNAAGIYLTYLQIITICIKIQYSQIGK